jgi:hypothetical protein
MRAISPKRVLVPQMIAQLVVVMENHSSVLSSTNELGKVTVDLTKDSTGPRRLFIDDANKFQVQDGITERLGAGFQTFINFYNFRNIMSRYIVYHIDIHDKGIAAFWLHSMLDGTVDQFPSRYLDTCVYWKCQTFPRDMTSNSRSVDNVIGYGDISNGWIGLDFHGLSMDDVYASIITKRNIEVFRHTDTWAELFRVMINGDGNLSKDKFWLVYHTMLDDDYAFDSMKQFIVECNRRMRLYTRLKSHS